MVSSLCKEMGVGVGGGGATTGCERAGGSAAAVTVTEKKLKCLTTLFLGVKPNGPAASRPENTKEVGTARSLAPKNLGWLVGCARSMYSFEGQVSKK